MSKDIQLDVNKWKRRWVAYLDLLGSKDMILKEEWYSVFDHYANAAESFERSVANVEKDWFSDTYILYSEDDSKGSFAAIHGSTENFINRLLLRGIPVCGAMACGEFYADKDKRLYFGKALIDAYNLGENINFITYILACSAVKRMIEVGLPIEERLNYAYVKVPYKENKEDCPEKLPAYIVGSSGTMNGQPFGINKLKELMYSVESPIVKQKYQNTIDFAERHLKHR